MIDAKAELESYKRMKELRRVIIDDFLQELKEEMDTMKYPCAGPRDAGVSKDEDRGYHIGIGQVQGIIHRIRP